MIKYIEILSSIAECALIAMFCNRFLGFKSNDQKAIKTIAFFALNCTNDLMLSQREGYELLAVIILFGLTLSYCLIFLKGNIYEKALVSLAPFLTVLPINLVILNLFSWLSGADYSEIVGNTGQIRIMILFFTRMAQFYLFEMVIKFKRVEHYSLNATQWILQLSCCIISFLISICLWIVSRSMNNSSKYFVFIYFLLIALNVLLYILLNKMGEDNKLKEDYKLSEQRLSAERQMAVEIKDRYIETKGLKHDINHCLIVISEMLASKKYEETQNYVKGLVDSKIYGYVYPMSTGKATIDAALYNKISECKSKGISIKCSIDTALDKYDDIDLSVLLSNILDNAIAGVKGCTNPGIELNIKNKKAYTIISCSNTISESVLDKNPNLVREDKNTDHGYGVSSIKSIAKKYDGNVEYYEINGQLVVEILLKWGNVQFTN